MKSNKYMIKKITQREAHDMTKGRQTREVTQDYTVGHYMTHMHTR